MIRALLTYALLVLRVLPGLFRSQSEQAIVELVLRRQLATYADKRARPRLALSIAPSGSPYLESGRSGCRSRHRPAGDRRAELPHDPGSRTGAGGGPKGAAGPKEEHPEVKATLDRSSLKYQLGGVHRQK